MSQQELNQQNVGSRALPDGLPIRSIAVPVQLVERSVSELTMRSHGYNFDKSKCSSDSRRMAYYAVGRAHGDQKRGRGGNQRCYFTGVAIPYGTPFYAGSVQQGPRTLVVFCLPSALGLSTMVAHSVSKEERERYLQSLPECDDQLLREMNDRYRDDFDTLPMQVRLPRLENLFERPFPGLSNELTSTNGIHYCRLEVRSVGSCSSSFAFSADCPSPRERCTTGLSQL